MYAKDEIIIHTILGCRVVLEGGIRGWIKGFVLDHGSQVLTVLSHKLLSLPESGEILCSQLFVLHIQKQIQKYLAISLTVEVVARRLQ